MIPRDIDDSTDPDFDDAEPSHRETDAQPTNCNNVNKQLSPKNKKRKQIQHNDERPFQCRVCDKRFKQTSHLKRHSATHSSDRPFQCEVCDKSFKQKATLKRHFATHSGERPFQCEVCDKSYTRNSTLMAHARTHTGENLL